MRGDRMKQRRESLGLSQQDLGDRIGIVYQSVARYEAGRSDPSGEMLAKIAVALDCSADWLIGLVDDPKEHLEEDALSPLERKLINAIRNGLDTDALQAFIDLRKTMGG